MEKSPKITALAITLNEAEVISDFLKSLDFVDEIIIVDSFSTDETVKIAQQFEKVKVYERAFDHFSAQKTLLFPKQTTNGYYFLIPMKNSLPK